MRFFSPCNVQSFPTESYLQRWIKRKMINGYDGTYVLFNLIISNSKWLTCGVIQDISVVSLELRCLDYRHAKHISYKRVLLCKSSFNIYTSGIIEYYRDVILCFQRAKLLLNVIYMQKSKSTKMDSKNLPTQICTMYIIFYQFKWCCLWGRQRGSNSKHFGPYRTLQPLSVRFV